jgi:hypothetical protein
LLISWVVSCWWASSLSRAWRPKRNHDFSDADVVVECRIYLRQFGQSLLFRQNSKEFPNWAHGTTQNQQSDFFGALSS